MPRNEDRICIDLSKDWNYHLKAEASVVCMPATQRDDQKKP